MRLLIIILSFFIASCRNHSSVTLSPDSTHQFNRIDSPATVDLKDTSVNSNTSLYVWFVDFENKTKQRNLNFKKENLNVDSLIKGLNQTHTKIKLDKVKISGDTLYTEIKDSEYLGEQIGSYGANAYIADVLITLTSITNINFVKIDFEDGSHISPGVWSKNDFKDYKETR